MPGILTAEAPVALLHIARRTAKEDPLLVMILAHPQNISYNRECVKLVISRERPYCAAEYKAQGCFDYFRGRGV